MPNESIHAIALQIAQASQKYEQFATEIEALNKRYEGTLSWVISLLGEPTDDMREIFGLIDDNKDQYVRSVIRCRNTLLKISQALLRLNEEKY